MRASILVLGPLRRRVSVHADVSLPGGCAIGARPVNLHVAGLRAMGADDLDRERLHQGARATRLHGARIVLDLVTVTGTENLMMAAACARGEIGHRERRARARGRRSRAISSNAMGAKIEGAGTDTIRIQGVERLVGTSYEVMPDRIESGTYLVAGAITGGRVS